MPSSCGGSRSSSPQGTWGSTSVSPMTTGGVSSAHHAVRMAAAGGCVPVVGTGSDRLADGEAAIRGGTPCGVHGGTKSAGVLSWDDGPPSSRRLTLVMCLLVLVSLMIELEACRTCFFFFFLSTRSDGGGGGPPDGRGDGVLVTWPVRCSAYGGERELPRCPSLFPLVGVVLRIALSGVALRR